MIRFLRFAVLLACLAFPGAALADEDYLGGFEGRWEGTLKRIPGESYDSFYGMSSAQNSSLQLAIAVRDMTVTVYTNAGGGWQEVKEGHFQLLAFKSNATVTSIDSSNQGPEAGWVETWNMTLTHKDRDSLLVAFARAVNNYDRPAETKAASGGSNARFFALAFGELKKVPQ